MSDASSSTPAPTPSPTPTPPTAPLTEPQSALDTSIASSPAGADPVATPPAPVAEPSPVSFTAADLTLPEGLASDDPAVGQFVTEMNEAKVPKEASQKLLEQHYAAMKKSQEAGIQLWKDTNKAWAEAVKADPEIGGTKLDSVVKPVIASVIDKFGGDGLRQALDLTGAGNHPAVVKAFYLIGEALGESRGAVQGDPAAQPKPVLGPQAMYPHLAKGN